MTDAIQDVLKATATQVRRAKMGDAVKYRAFEQTIGESLREVERRAHEVALAALDPDVPRVQSRSLLLLQN